MAKGFRLRGLDPVFFFSHLLYLGLSYCIYLAPHIAPSTFPYFGFLPIIYPILVLINLIVIVYLFWKRAPYAIVFLLLSIGLYFPISKTYQYFGKKVEVEPNLKIITLNGQYLRQPGFVDFFQKENADIVLLQEVYWRNETFENLKDSAFPDYYHEKHSLIQVFSKYPIIEFKKIFSGENRTTGLAAYADLDRGADTLRVINVYLEPMFIDKKLVKESINDMQTAEANSIVLKNKLTKGFLMHEIQIKKLLPYIQTSPHPVILAGDLNAVPNSYEYQQISHWLKDSYPQLGRSPATSFHEFKYPLRLDYIFNSEEFTPVRYKVLKDVKLSDHYPVVAEFKFP